MHLVRYAIEDESTAVAGKDIAVAGKDIAVAGKDIALGIRDDDGTLRRLPFDSMAEALRIPLHELRAIVEAPHPAVEGHVRLLAPVDGRTEVWGSGVTYRRSREARMEESQTADIYDRVHDAQRPELFFKSVSWRVVTDGEPIGVRADSAINVPEPELAVVANADGDAVGYTVCNDVTSRAIESENPLYLPQAKIYAGSCAIAPGIRPAWEIENPLDLEVSCSVVRNGVAAWSARTSTSAMKRSISELLSWLYRQDAYPEGAILSTGTGIVPDLDFTLVEGDLVDIEISDVGRLQNRVAMGMTPFVALRDQEVLR